MVTFEPPAVENDADVYWRAATLYGESAPVIELKALTGPGFLHWLRIWQYFLGDDFHRYLLSMGVLFSFLPAALFLILMAQGCSLIFASTSALVLTSSPNTVYFDTSASKAPLEMAFCLASFALLLWLVRPNQKYRWVMMGLLVIVLRLWVTVQSAALAACAFCFGALILFWWKEAALRKQGTCLGLGVGALLLSLLAPGTLTRQSPGEREVDAPFWPNWGFNLNLGFHPDATGYYASINGITPNLLGHTLDSKLYAETMAGRSLTPSEANQWFVGQVREFISSNPGEAVAGLWLKARAFFDAFEPFEDQQISSLDAYVPWTRFLPFSFGFLLLSLPVGLFLLGARNQAKQRALFACSVPFIAYPLLFCLLTVVFSRYRHVSILTLSLCLASVVDSLKVQIVEATKRRYFDVVLNRRGIYLSAILSLTALAAWLAPPLEVGQAPAIAKAVARGREKTQSTWEAIKSLPSLEPSMDLTTRSRRIQVLHKAEHYTSAYKEAAELHLLSPYVDDESSLIDIQMGLWMSDVTRLRWLLKEWAKAVEPDSILHRMDALKAPKVLKNRVALEMEELPQRNPFRARP